MSSSDIAPLAISIFSRGSTPPKSLTIQGVYEPLQKNVCMCAGYVLIVNVTLIYTAKYCNYVHAGGIKTRPPLKQAKIQHISHKN